MVRLPLRDGAIIIPEATITLQEAASEFCASYLVPHTSYPCRVALADSGLRPLRTQHYSRTILMDRSSACTECVNAPTEIRPTPVSATSRTVARVMPPDASSSTLPAVRST